MSPDEHLTMLCEAFMWRRVVDALQLGIPMTRELRIQTLKLQRLLEGRVTVTRKILGSGGAAKKWKKTIGQHDARCGQQAKLVRKMFTKAFQEWLRVEWPKHGRPYTKKAFRAWKSGFDEGIAENVGKIKKQVIGERKSAPRQALKD